MARIVFQGRTGMLLAAWLSVAGCASELVVDRGGGSLDQGPDAAPDGGVETSADAQILWNACDNQGDMFKEARTGDRCNFEGSCGDTKGCRITTADCTAGVLRMTTAEACSGGTAPATTICGRVAADPCCVTLTACDAVGGEATVCSSGCGSLRADAQADTVVSCSWPEPPAAGAPCEGDFVCGSDGGPPAQGAISFNSLGEVYWCGAGVVQKGVTGPQFLGENL